MPRQEPKVHKKHRHYNKPLCGMQSALVTEVDAEVTCRSCRLWLPVTERELPKPSDEPPER